MFQRIFLVFFLLFSISLRAEESFFEDVVKYLASTELEGRRVGSPGNELAENFVENKIKEAGLLPLEDSYRESFTIFTEMEKNGDNLVRKSNGEIEPNFQPISYSLTGDLKNTDVIFVGYGISIPKQDQKIKYDDYEGVDVTDKIVVVLTGDPGVKNPKSLFRDPEYIGYRSIHYKMKNAINHGAKGILIIADPLSNTSYPEETLPVFNATEGGGDRFSIIAGNVTNKWFNQFLKNTDTLKLQQEITTSQLPVTFKVDLKLDLSVHLKKKTGRVSNIVGVIPGNDETLKRQVVVVGAHLDHLGYGGDASMEQNAIGVSQGKIHFGADDNASGVSMVLKLARELKKLNLKRTFVFVLFNAEEVGLLGSKNFVESWVMHEEKYGKVVAMLNYDMVGRFSTTVSVIGVNTALEWKSLVAPIQSSIPFEAKGMEVGSSDHAPFVDKKIPALFFTTGAHGDYHTSRDTAEKINFQAMGQIENYSIDLVSQLEKSLITYNPDYNDGQDDTSRPRGYGAHLGCVPEFGQPDSVKGVMCIRASTGSPAELAGILPNDVLIQIGDIEITSVYDLAFALKYYRAGDTVELAWKRGDQVIKAQVVLQRSKRE